MVQDVQTQCIKTNQIHGYVYNEHIMRVNQSISICWGYEAVHEHKMCSSTVAYSGSNTNRGKFNEELGRRFVDPSDCARSKALKNDCSSEIFQFNEETGSCQCCTNDISLQEDPTKKWSVFKLPTGNVYILHDQIDLYLSRLDYFFKYRLCKGWQTSPCWKRS